MNKREALEISSVDFKDFLISVIGAGDSESGISGVARHIGLHPSTLNRYLNEPRSNLPAHVIPYLPEDIRSAALHWLDNRSGNPMKGVIDTSDLNGSIRDECDGMVEALGEIIHLERTQPGARSAQAKIKLFQTIRQNALRGEQEIGNRGK